jgi:hypothetical protein
MWCRDASYALRHGVNTRTQQMLAKVSGGTCDVVLREVVSRTGLRLLDPAAQSSGTEFPQRNQGLTGRSASALVSQSQAGT